MENTVRVFEPKGGYDQAMTYMRRNPGYICLCLVISCRLWRFWVVGEFYQVIGFITSKKDKMIKDTAYSCIHEMIRPHMATRLFMDVEDKTRPLGERPKDAKRMHDLLTMLCGYLDKVYAGERRLYKEYVVVNACTNGKMSYHATFPFIIFMTPEDLRQFMSDFMSYVRADVGRTVMMATHDKKGTLVDVSMYEKENGTLRMANSFKYDETDTRLISPLLYDEPLSTMKMLSKEAVWYLSGIQTFNYTEENSIYGDDDVNPVWTKRGTVRTYNRDRTSCVVTHFTYETLCYRDARCPACIASNGSLCVHDPVDPKYARAIFEEPPGAIGLLPYLFESTVIGRIWKKDDVLPPKAGKPLLKTRATFRAKENAPQFCPGLLIKLMLQPESASIVLKNDVAPEVTRKRTETMLRDTLKAANPHYATVVNRMRATMRANEGVPKPTEAYNLCDFTIPDACYRNATLCHHKAHVWVYACKGGTVRCKCYEKCIATSVVVYGDDRVKEMMKTDADRAAEAAWKQRKQPQPVKPVMVTINKTITKKPIQVPQLMMAARPKHEILSNMGLKNKGKK